MNQINNDVTCLNFDVSVEGEILQTTKLTFYPSLLFFKYILHKK